MAAVNLKVSQCVKLNLISFFAAALISLFVYFLFLQIALWDECSHLQPSSTPSVYSALERFHIFLLHLFHSTESLPPKHTRWHHHDISDLCNQSLWEVSIFIITTQIVRDIHLFTSTLCDVVAKLLFSISVICQNIMVNLIETVWLTRLCCLLVLSGTCMLVVYCYRKQRCSERKFTSLSPRDSNYNSSIRLTPYDHKQSRYELRTGGNVNVRHGQRSRSLSSVCFSIITWVLGLVACSIFLSIPWEFIRLYQKAVAHRAASVDLGLPPACTPDTLGWVESIKTWLRWHLSWSHDHNPCTEYYYASLVDPLWEVNPLLVISSVLSRGVSQPMEIISSSLGRSLRVFFAEIPSHWQPVIMLVAVVTSLAFLLILCSYRVSIPLLLRIEPKTPVSSPADVKSCKKSHNFKPRRNLSRHALGPSESNGDHRYDNIRL